MTLATLDAQRDATRLLIEHEGREVALKRKPGYVPDGAGGRKRKTGAAQFQGTRLRFFSSVTSEGTYFLRDVGERYEDRHVLIGLFDDDIQEHDTFELDGRNYEVVYVHPDRRYETRAVVYSYGK